MKIVFLCRSLSYGGAERQLIALAKGLQNKGHDVVILTFYNPPLNGVYASDGLKIVGLNKQHRWDICGFLKNLWSVIKDYKPDILHSYLTVPNVLTSLLKILNPQLKVVLGFRASDMKWNKYGLMARTTSYLEKKLSRFSDLIIVNSKAGYHHAVSCGVKANLLKVIPNGIDTEKFQFEAKVREDFRNELGIQDNTIVFALVARLDAMKDHPTFLKAAQYTIKTNQSSLFICIGNGTETYKSSLINLTNELGISDKVKWIDARDPVPYSAFDIVCSSSSYGEGFPNVLGEAMASGIPCVATDVGDSKDVIGSYGIIVESQNPQALHKAEVELLEKLKKDMLSEKCRKYIQENFSVKRMIDDSENVLIGLIS